jgi:predicted nucleic-acid-binding protein
LRLIITDNPKQNELAAQFLDSRSASDPAYVPLLVFAEACWVLKRVYRFRTDQISMALLSIMSGGDIVFEEEDFIHGLLSDEGAFGGDIADHVIAHMATQAGCSKTITFDQAAAQNIPGMELLA